jgi:hypothetical protein
MGFKDWIAMRQTFNGGNMLHAALVSIALILAANQAPATESRYVSVPDLVKQLQTQDIDRIVETLNAVKQMTYQGEILPFLHDLWNERKDAHPNVPWAIVTGNRVRIEIADVLVQAHKNGLIELDIEPFRKFAIGLINSTDMMVVWSALGVLAVIDDERDVDAIVMLAEHQRNMGTFRASVSALVHMCNPAAAQGLDHLKRQLSDPDRKTFVIKTRQEFDAFKTRTNWCAKALQ